MVLSALAMSVRNTIQTRRVATRRWTHRAILVLRVSALFFGTKAYCQNTEIVLKKPLSSRTLSGHVRLERDSAGLAGVLVEVCDAQWKKPIVSTTTDSDGAFSFQGFKTNKIYYLRLSIRNADTLLVKVNLKSSGPKELLLAMTNAT